MAPSYKKRWCSVAGDGNDWFCASYEENWTIGFDSGTDGAVGGDVLAGYSFTEMELYSEQNIVWYTEWHVSRVHDQLIRFALSGPKEVGS